MRVAKAKSAADLKSFSLLSELSVQNSYIPLVFRTGKITISVTMKPNPAHGLQHRSPHDDALRCVIEPGMTVIPVVLMPDIASKMALVGIDDHTISGTAPAKAAMSQTVDVNRNVCTGLIMKSEDNVTIPSNAPGAPTTALEIETTLP